ncbi:hypothetical protein BS47DRAFT_1362071 [Hydnum rufescens UP504]|uniref:Uncharacterized protein n=1 Tax=Hydnum rufescens UP504 TaxID=1448309 RepID=A0A9P6AZ19_9AGAM|nr:hypothetical protein BS47DRAFT_1362071 [Hydnum rufescens UP504]
MEKYPEIAQSIIPWANMYFPSNSCAACGSVVPSNMKHYRKLYLHLQTCPIYREKERLLGLNEWDAAYHDKGYIPRPVLRDGIPIRNMAMMEIMKRHWENQPNEKRAAKIFHMLLIDHENWTIDRLGHGQMENIGGYLEDEKRIKPWMIFKMGLKCPPSIFVENTLFDSRRGRLVGISEGESLEDFKQGAMNLVYASHPKLMEGFEYPLGDVSLPKSGVGFLEVVDTSGDIIPRNTKPIFSLRSIRPQPYLHASDPQGRMGKFGWKGGMLPAGSISILGSTPNHCGTKVIRIYGAMLWFLWPSIKENVDVWNEHCGEIVSLEWGLRNLKGLQITSVGSDGAELEPGTIICIVAATECCWADVYYLSDDIGNKVLSIRRWNALWRRKCEKNGRSWKAEDAESKSLHVEMANRLGRDKWFDFDP